MQLNDSIIREEGYVQTPRINILGICSSVNDVIRGLCVKCE